MGETVVRNSLKWELNTNIWGLSQTFATCSFHKLFILLCVISRLQTAGLSLNRDTPIGSGTSSPYLEPIKYNTTVFMGQTAYLPCVVKHLGDKTVSWIRKRDLHILTSGNQVYTNDKRFSLLRDAKLLNAWTLKISSITKKDEGTYECQINTEPKLTVMLHLMVLGSPDEDTGSGALALGMLDSPYHQRDDHRSNGYEAKILGPSLIQLEPGQLANFTCTISHGGPPPNVTWFLNEIPIQKTRGGFNVDTERSSFITISQLVIVKVDKRDEGKYSCGGVIVYPDSVVLKVRPRHPPNSKSRWGDASSSAPTLYPKFYKIPSTLSVSALISTSEISHTTRCFMQKIFSYSQELLQFLNIPMFLMSVVLYVGGKSIILVS